MYNKKWEPATLHFHVRPQGGTVLNAFIDEPALAYVLWFGERDLLWQILYWLTPEPFTAFFIVPCKKIIAEILKYLQQSNYWKNI